MEGHAKWRAVCVSNDQIQGRTRHRQDIASAGQLGTPSGADCNTEDRQAGAAMGDSLRMETEPAHVC